MRVDVVKEKCTGCGLCYTVCSLAHLGSVDRNRSAVRVSLDDLGESKHTPSLCRQCKKMKCLDDAVKRNPALDCDEEKRSFIWREPARAALCPFNGCFEYKGSVYHCDLCGGDPQCVKLCTQGALVIKEEKNN